MNYNNASQGSCYGTFKWFYAWYHTVHQVYMPWHYRPKWADPREWKD